MTGRRTRGGWTLALALAALCLTASPLGAVHESTNTLVFAPVDEAATPSSRGDGVIDYRGGDHTESRWTATFRFDGLAPTTPYVVAVQGRFGADGTIEATAFSEICSFTSDASGAGGCWYYFVVLERLANVDLRQSSLGGPIILQATREDGPGSIAGQPNLYSPPSVFATPAATPSATPMGPGR